MILKQEQSAEDNPYIHKMSGSNNRITDDLVIVPDESDEAMKWTPKVPRGSIYLEVEQYLDEIKNDPQFNAPWFIDHETGEKLMVSEIKWHSRRYGALLHRNGMKKGDVVRIFSDSNDVQVFFVAFGAWIHGGIVSFGDPDLAAEKITKQLRDSECQFIFIHKSHFKVLKDALSLLPDEKRPRIFTYGPSDIFDAFDISEALEDLTEQDCPEPVKLDVHEDVAVIMYTAGTTGQPKGVMHTHYSAFNLVSDIMRYLDKNCTYIQNIPLMLYSSVQLSITLLLHGVTIVNNIGDEYDGLDKRLLDAIYEHQPTAIFLVAGQFIHFSNSTMLNEKVDRQMTKCIRTFSPDMGAVPDACEKRIRHAFPSIHSVLNLYGTAETGLVSVCETRKLNSLGRIMPGNSVKIVDPSHGDCLPPGRRGALRIKSDLMMKGYLKKPGLTNSFFDEDGFARVGDVGYYDENGDVFLIDRLVNHLRIENHEVYPAEVEFVMHRHKSVRDCLVWGKSLANGNSLISATIVLRDDFEPSQDLAEEIRSFVNKKLSEFKRVKGEITFEKAIQRNKLGKLVRKERRSVFNSY